MAAKSECEGRDGRSRERDVGDHEERADEAVDERGGLASAMSEGVVGAADRDCTEDSDAEDPACLPGPSIITAGRPTVPALPSISTIGVMTVLGAPPMIAVAGMTPTLASMPVSAIVSSMMRWARSSSDAMAGIQQLPMMSTTPTVWGPIVMDMHQVTSSLLISGVGREAARWSADGLRRSHSEACARQRKPTKKSRQARKPSSSRSRELSAHGGQP